MYWEIYAKGFNNELCGVDFFSYVNKVISKKHYGKTRKSIKK